MGPKRGQNWGGVNGRNRRKTLGILLRNRLENGPGGGAAKRPPVTVSKTLPSLFPAPILARPESGFPEFEQSASLRSQKTE